MADPAIGRLQFGSRLVFDGGSPQKEPLLKEHWTRNEGNKKKPLNLTKDIARQRLDKLKQLRNELEEETEETNDVLKSGLNSSATNQHFLIQELEQVEDLVDESQSIVAQEIEEEKRHTCHMKEAVASSLEMANGIEEIQKIMKPIGKAMKEQLKAKDNLSSGRKTAEELARVLASGKRNIEKLEEHCHVDKEGDRLLFAEASTALFESNKAFLSLRRLAINQSSPLGQLLLKTEILSQDVVYGLRSLLHSPMSLDALSDPDTTSDSQTSQQSMGDSAVKVIKIDSFTTMYNPSTTSTVNTTILPTGSKTPLSFSSSHSPFRKATSPPMNTSLTVSGLDASFSEAELIEHYNWEKNKDAPEEGVLTARSISSQTRTTETVGGR